jgi:transcriptional regulator with XRE-family HTH domain
MVDIPSSMRTRSVGNELIGLRKAAGYNGAEFARKLGWENSRLNRIEHGKYNISEVDITQYVTMLGHPRSVLDHLLTMLRQSDDGFVVQPHGTRLPDQLHTLIRHETTARTIHNLELVVVPGLLQTRRYAEALMRSQHTADEELLQVRLQARMDRQCMFNRPMQPACTFYIQEFALRLPVGGNQVMNDQIMRLAFTSNNPGISIRIIPTSIGPHAGLAGTFMRMGYAEGDQLPIIYVENEGTSLFMDEPNILDAHSAVLKRLDRTALDEEQSRSWLMKIASEYDRPDT